MNTWRLSSARYYSVLPRSSLIAVASDMRQDELNHSYTSIMDNSPDEFDVYFARAALAAEIDSTCLEAARRGSLPGGGPPQLIVEDSNGPRRAASCKYPSRRRSGTHSRESSRSPRRPSHESSPVPSPLAVTPSYATESSLRAPSPRCGMKSHSAPHSRSSSWKKMKRPRSIKDFQEMHGDSPGRRERTNSIPLEESIRQKLQELKLIQSEDCCVVRNFTISSKHGVVNRGDSFKRKSNQSLASDNGSCGSAVQNRSRVNSQGGSTAASSVGSPACVRVLMLGDTGVGKTALLQQFMTSEYMGAIETSFDDECEKTVSVLLDGEDTMLDFLDLSRDQEFRNVADVEAFVLVYSITDRASFHFTIDLIHQLRSEMSKTCAMIVVANKSDLVRTRQVTAEEGIDICQDYDCKYVEVSAALNHRVDELLAGIVKQIRLNPKREKRRRKLAEQQADELSGSGSNGCVQNAKGIISKLFAKRSSPTHTSKSCDNLLVL